MKNTNSIHFFVLILTSLSFSVFAQSYSEHFKLSKFNGTKNVTSTIVINKAGVYDFKNVLHIWKGNKWTCNVQKENGPQILRVEASNVTIKNFAYIGDGKTHGSNGLGDPIHITSCGKEQGNLCPGKGPSNVVLDGVFGHACEDMITIGTPGGSNVTVQNSTLIAGPNKANWDKTIQVNFGTDMKFYDNTFIGCMRGIRLKPNTSASIEGNTFKNCNTAVQMSTKDKDIAPMKNGPSSAFLRDNNFGGAGVKCKDGGKIASSGSVVCK
jgi:hypothetical protein